MKTKPLKGPAPKCTCGNAKAADSGQCIDCAKSQRREVAGYDFNIERIRNEYLELKSVQKVAALYGLTDNGLRKRLLSQSIQPSAIFTRRKTSP